MSLSEVCATGQAETASSFLQRSGPEVPDRTSSNRKSRGYHGLWFKKMGVAQKPNGKIRKVALALTGVPPKTNS